MDGGVHGRKRARGVKKRKRKRDETMRRRDRHLVELLSFFLSFFLFGSFLSFLLSRSLWPSSFLFVSFCLFFFLSFCHTRNSHLPIEFSSQLQSNRSSSQIKSKKKRSMSRSIKTTWKTRSNSTKLGNTRYNSVKLR